MARDFVHRASSADIQVKPQEGFFAPGLARCLAFLGEKKQTCGT